MGCAASCIGQLAQRPSIYHSVVSCQEICGEQAGGIGLTWCIAHSVLPSTGMSFLSWCLIPTSGPLGPPYCLGMLAWPQALSSFRNVFPPHKNPCALDRGNRQFDFCSPLLPFSFLVICFSRPWVVLSSIFWYTALP